MKKLSFLVYLVLIVLSVQAQSAVTDVPSKPDFGDGDIKPELAARAEAVVKKWFDALLRFDTIQIKKYTGIPFAWDRVEIISDEKVFMQKFRESQSEKMKEDPLRARLLNDMSFKTIASYRRMIDKIIPIDVYVIQYTVKKNEREDGGRIAVLMTPEPKVIGLSD